MAAPCIALLGDSVFDSRPYLRGMPDMAARLKHALPAARAELLAVSGSRLADLPRQLAAAPAGATHLIVSIGGNDLLDLGRRLGGGAGALAARVAQAGALLGRFEELYAEACGRIAAHGVPAAVCTIYEPPVSDPMLRQIGAAALQLVNAAIERQARGQGLGIIDLRSVCREPADFFDPIHPSAHGADKIAAALAHWVAHG